MPIHLEPRPDNVHWGYFDARLPPRVTIDSGERLTISSVSGGPELMPAAPLKVPPALPAIHQKVTRQLGPHILTGPVAIKGAQPGQVLQASVGTGGSAGAVFRRDGHSAPARLGHDLDRAAAQERRQSR